MTVVCGGMPVSKTNQQQAYTNSSLDGAPAPDYAQAHSIQALFLTSPLPPEGDGRVGGGQRKNLTDHSKLFWTLFLICALHTPMEPRTKPLSEHLAGIVSMLLGVLRAYGWRALFILPELFRTQRMIRAMFDELITLAKAFEAGTLPPVPAPLPEPEGWQPEDWQDGSAAPKRPAAQPRTRARPRPATLPAAEAAPDRPRAAICAPPPPPPPRRVPQPYSVLRLPAGILVTARSC
jgi:hypothetical protein